MNINKKKTYLLTVFPSIQTEFTRLLSLAAMLPAEQSLVKGSGVRWKMDTFGNEEEFGNKEVLGEGLKVLISFVLITHVKPWLRVSCGGGGGLFDEGELTREKWHSSLPQPPTLQDTPPQITWNRHLLYLWLFFLLWLPGRQILPVRSNKLTLFLTFVSNSLLFS